jgi:uncharacterized protein YdhG (YjbR/CyaY superfamily)
MTTRARFETVDEYIASFPKDIQKILREIQKTIGKAVPGAEEVISYQVPAFKYKGWIFYYSAYTNHFSLSCPPPFTVFDEFKEELAGYDISKSAIRFPLDEPVPVKLIADMARFRARANEEQEKKKTPAKKKAPK